jgi:hypothetical protein
LEDQVDEQARQQILDDENLRLLRICYFIAAGLTTVTSIFVLLYMLMFTFIFTRIGARPGMNMPPAFIGSIFGVIGVVLFLLMIGMAVMHCLTAMRLTEKRSRIFCMVVAVITCMSIPMGTLLGIWTLLVLSRPTVKQAFEEKPTVSN